MRIIKNSGNYLQHHSRAYLIIFLSSLGAFLVLFLTRIYFLPIYRNLGLYETIRGMAITLFLLFLMISYKYYSKYKVGLDGEKLVTEYLSANLSDDYYLINDIIRPSKRDRVNIDHILLWKDGILVIETKNNKSEIKFYGDNWNVSSFSPVYQVKGNAAYIYNLIGSSGTFLLGTPWVTGLVVFPSAKLTFKGDTSTPVKNLVEVATFLKSIEGRNEYSVEKINEIAGVIVDSSRKAALAEGGFFGILWQDLRDFFF